MLLLIGERGASPEVYAEMKAKLGLDLPWHQQYLQFLLRALKGDLGESIISKEPVVREFFSRFPATLELGLMAFLISAVIGVPLGILAAIRRNSFWDYSVMGGSLLGYSMPIFWWGLILILLFSVKLGWTPVSGRIGVTYDLETWSGFYLLDSLTTAVRAEHGMKAWVDALRHLTLPSIVLATIPLASIARMTRSSMLEVIGEDYIRTARSKGLSHPRIIWVHALRNALVPIITVMGLILGSIVTGAILTETIFSWPGIGKWLVKSVQSRDYPVVQGGILLIATLIVFINAIVDLLYAWANPRMRT